MIQKYNDLSKGMFLDKDRIQETNLYFQTAEAELKDSFFYIGQFETLEFYRIQNWDSVSKVRIGEDLLANIYIKMDNRQLKVQRQVYSFFMLLGDIGGI